MSWLFDIIVMLLQIRVIHNEPNNCYFVTKNLNYNTHTYQIFLKINYQGMQVKIYLHHCFVLKEYIKHINIKHYIQVSP